MTSPDDLADVREQVRARYAAAAVMAGGMPSYGEPCSGAEEAGTGAGQYAGTNQDGIPGLAVAASLGCGNPVAVADLRDGETVLDLGSGGGLDVLLSALRVGPASKAYGLVSQAGATYGRLDGVVLLFESGVAVDFESGAALLFPAGSFRTCAKYCCTYC